MALSRRSFVRTVGLGGVSSAFIAARGREDLLAAGLRGVQAPASPAGRIAATIKISSNENPRGPSPAALEAVRSRTTHDVGRYPDNIEALTDVIAKMHGAKPENVWLGTGSGPELTAAARAFLSPAKHLVTGDPSYEAPIRDAKKIGAPSRAFRSTATSGSTSAPWPKPHWVPASSSSATPTTRPPPSIRRPRSRPSCGG